MKSAQTVSINDIVGYLETVAIENDIVTFKACANQFKNTNIPFRIDGLIVILCKDGVGKLTVDLNEYEIRKNSLIVLQPRNYIQLGYFSEEFQANCIACSLHIIEDVLLRLTDILPILLHSQLSPVSNLCENDAQSLEMMFGFLAAKLRGPKTPLLKKKLLCGLQAVLFEIMDIQLGQHNGTEIKKTRKEELLASFIIAVSREFMVHREVSYYADKLCISTKHLSTTVKEASGRTPGEWIENYVVMEAKILLRSSNLTIQEISRKLNFPSQSFFGKYFRNITGISPTAYRKENL